MNHYPPLSPYDAVTHMYAEEMLASFREQMHEVECLADELNDLLANYQATLEHEGMHEQLETLIGWAQRYRQELLVVDKISQNGHACLRATVHNRPDAGSEELGRPEDQAGPIIDQHTNIEVEDFTSAARQVGDIASRIEYLFGRPTTKASHAEQ